MEKIIEIFLTMLVYAFLGFEATLILILSIYVWSCD